MCPIRRPAALPKGLSRRPHFKQGIKHRHNQPCEMTNHWESAVKPECHQLPGGMAVDLSQAQKNSCYSRGISFPSVFIPGFAEGELWTPLFLRGILDNPHSYCNRFLSARSWEFMILGLGLTQFCQQLLWGLEASRNVLNIKLDNPPKLERILGR